MKKILSACLAAVFAFTAVPAAVSNSGGTAYAMTVVSDAKTAVKKNAELFLKKLEEADVDENFTLEDLENLLYGACEYSANSFVGTAFYAEKFRIVSPTETKAGYMSAVVSIYQDDAEEAFEVKKEIPAYTDSKAAGGVSIDDGNGDDSNDNQQNSVGEKVSDKDISAMKSTVATAKKAITDAIWDFEVSNDTTAADMLGMAKNAVKNIDGVTVTLDKADFKLVKSSTTVPGTVSATFDISFGTVEDRVTAAKTVPVYTTDESKKIDEDKSLMSKALSALDYTNRITQEDILNAALNAAKNGSTATWKSFEKKNATFHDDGSIRGFLTITLGSEERELGIFEDILKLLRRIPTDRISVNKEEWEVLRIVNVERQKEGLFLLTMVDDIQKACDIREVEIAEKFSHTRPNGEGPFGVLSGFKYTKAGENIYRCNSPSMAVSGEKAMISWMNSPGHRANILTADYDYIGVGTYDNEVLGTAVQLFAGVSYPLVSAVTASGKTNYIDEDAMQKDYLICTASTGLVSYVPLDVDYMTKTDKGYTLNLRLTEPIYLTVGNGNSTNTTTTDKTTDKTTENKTDNTANQGKNETDNTVFSFTDVKPADYYADAVKWAVEKNITKGTSATTFSPDLTCTRAQILTFLWRAVGSPASETANPFTDVSKDDYFYNAAIWAYEKGMVDGTKFEGDTPCTRASTVVYLFKNADSPKTKSTSSFKDVANGADYAEAVSWAVENSVTSGVSETEFAPDTICSRGQIVTFLNRAVK